MKNQFLKTRLFGFAAFCSLILGSMAGCAEVAGSGAFVSIPSVNVQCTSGGGAGCMQNTSRIAYVIYTTSGCTNPDFGAAASGSVTVTCTAGGGCTGTVTQFIDSSSTTATSIREGVYSVCVTIDMDGVYTGEPASGDMLGTLNNTRIVSGTATQSVTSFSLKP